MIQRKRQDRGFTLMELIIGMTAGVVISLVAYVLYAPVGNWMFTQQRRSSVTEASVAVMRTLKEIRRIKSPSQITSLAADNLQFVDIDNNSVTFQKVGTDYLRSGDVLARDVQGLAFTYLDENGGVTAVAADVRVIRVEIAIAYGDQVVRLQSAAQVMNL